MGFDPVPLDKCLRLINHGPLVIVTTASGDRVNAAPVQWNTPVNDDPPTVALSLDVQNFTHELIQKTGVFVLNIPDERLLPAVRVLGARSGRDGDKIHESGIRLEPGSRFDVPRLVDALGYLECRVKKTVGLEGVSVVFGEVVGAGVQPEKFIDYRWANDARTLHHMGGGTFALAGDRRSLPE